MISFKPELGLQIHVMHVLQHKGERKRLAMLVGLMGIESNSVSFLVQRNTVCISANKGYYTASKHHTGLCVCDRDRKSETHTAVELHSSVLPFLHVSDRLGPALPSI